MGIGGIGRKLELLERALEIAEGTPNETALPLAYWRSGRRPDTGPLDPARDGCGLLWYAPLVPMSGLATRRYVEFVERCMIGHGLEPLVTLTSLSERCWDSTVPVLFDRGGPDATVAARRCLRDLVEAGRERGFVPYRIGIDDMDWLAEHAPLHQSLARRLKASLDSQAIMAPGRYVGETPEKRGSSGCRSALQSPCRGSGSDL
jgi:hypothetical protein